ncbi:MAG TPA: efflux RND transporter periplasmic adaptor subunit [Thermoanaerobaculia bacterium]|jgi:multidrug efflux system membrane fusion protein|nr:efflux RND transporter periplasmic adaptor subunit [Thermoanaerobaculia bacterium]
MKSISIRTSVVGLLGFAALALAGCRHEAPAAFERPPAPVAVAAAVTRDVPVYLDEVGRCVAREVVSIQPQVSGRITQIHFTDGAHLRKGDPLFTIDPRPFRAQLAAAEANLAQAKAALDLARIQYDRAASLIQTKAIAQQEYDIRKNAVDVAAAQVEQGEAAVQTARLNLEYTTIRSPIDGRAGQRLVDLGNVVSAMSSSSGSLLVIQRLDPVYADFTVPENDLTAVQQNMARGSLKVEVRLPDEPGEPRIGALTFLDNAVQDGTGTVKLRATIPNDDHRFWPGRFVKIRLVLDTLEKAVLVPAAAPQASAQGPFVYVVKDDSTAEQRTVTPGQRQGDLVVISQGVKPGERVVVNGQLGVTPGGKVRVAGGEGAGATELSSTSTPVAKKEGKS